MRLSFLTATLPIDTMRIHDADDAGIDGDPMIKSHWSIAPKDHNHDILIPRLAGTVSGDVRCAGRTQIRSQRL